jgi:hypothetical protein
MLNKLDQLIVIPKPLLKWLILTAKKYYREMSLSEIDWAIAEYEDKLSRTKNYLAQDNTGWAAVPVEETRQMMDAARQYKNLLTPWGRAYRAMLNASPPLLGGGE